MAGPNFIGLDKGFLATGGSQAYLYGECVTLTAADTVARNTVADVVNLGICQENLDAAKTNTGKAVVNVRIMGISRAIAGAAIVVNAKLTNDTSARVVTQAGAAGTAVLGIALEPAASAGDWIAVLLTPFNTK